MVKYNFFSFLTWQILSHRSCQFSRIFLTNKMVCESNVSSRNCEIFTGQRSTEDNLFFTTKATKIHHTANKPQNDKTYKEGLFVVEDCHSCSTISKTCSLGRARFMWYRLLANCLDRRRNTDQVCWNAFKGLGELWGTPTPKNRQMNKPVHIPPRRILEVLKILSKNWLEELEQQGVIEKVTQATD